MGVWVVSLAALTYFCVSSSSFAAKDVGLESPPFVCACEGVCGDESQCNGQRCYSALEMTNGVYVVLKGCLPNVEQVQLTCSTPASTSQVVIECCTGDWCNSNLTATAPPDRTPRAPVPGHPRRRAESWARAPHRASLG